MYKIRDKIKDKIKDNLYSKILGIFPNTKTKYICRLNGNKIVRVSLSKHKTKAGRQLALFCRMKYRNEKLVIH